MFVGDSRGKIHVWDISLRHGTLFQENHFKIMSKELEGDQINSIRVNTDAMNELFVHSRDSCIRVVRYEASQGIKVKKRFFGSLCKEMTVRSDVSPDGQFLVAGSEDGKPRIYDAGL